MEALLWIVGSLIFLWLVYAFVSGKFPFREKAGGDPAEDATGRAVAGAAIFLLVAAIAALYWIARLLIFVWGQT